MANHPPEKNITKAEKEGREGYNPLQQPPSAIHRKNV